MVISALDYRLTFYLNIYIRYTVELSLKVNQFIPSRFYDPCSDTKPLFILSTIMRLTRSNRKQNALIALKSH